jgi:chromate transporter
MVFLAFLRLGTTSFGGPIAHIGYFREEFVARRKWVDETTYAHIVALCQFLPGPASSQVGIVLGLTRAGALGAVAAWLGFTLPSAIVMTVFAYGLNVVPGIAGSPWIHGLLVAAVAVVASATLGMAKSLCPDRPRQTIAILSATVILLGSQAPAIQVLAIVLGAIYGWRFLRSVVTTSPQPLPIRLSTGVAAVCATLLVLGLVATPFVAQSGGPISVFARFFTVGSLVFGGGHVVLPLLQAQVVPAGWVSDSGFIAGYGAAQAVPGPLFTFAAYLGAVMHGPVHGVSGAALALIAIFLPSFLLIGAILPFWNRLQSSPAVIAALAGVNAVVVGLLTAALYQPIWVTAIRSSSDLALALAAFLLLQVWKVQPWMVVAFSATGAAALAQFH